MWLEKISKKFHTTPFSTRQHDLFLCRCGAGLDSLFNMACYAQYFQRGRYFAFTAVSLRDDNNISGRI